MNIHLEVAPSNGRPQCPVMVESIEHGSYRDSFNTDSATSRRHFVAAVSDRFDTDASWLDAAICKAADDADAQADDDADDVERVREDNQATKLVKLAQVADLFHNPDGDAFARYPVGQKDALHFEVARIRTKPFRQWLARRFYEAMEKTPSSQAMQDALGVLEGAAVYDGEQHAVHIRLAEHDGRICIDLCNDTWQVVEVSADGWRVIDESPVRFRRAKAMLPLPIPDRNGDVNELRLFANVSDDDWPLVLAWLVAALRPGFPYPILAVSGEQGSAKSTLSKILRLIVDPNTAPLRSEPRDPRDLMIAANNGHVVALDNLSHVKVWLSDCLCRLSTGGGFSTRTLYENDDETIFNAMRPVVLNGIEELATRSDLADRSIMLNLPTIPEADRKTEAELWQDFHEALPRIFGGLLDAVVGATTKAATVHLGQLTRMADFAIWSTAAEESLGLADGAFMRAYAGNREDANAMTIDASPVGKWLVSFVDDLHEWSGTSTELLAELEARADDKTKRLKSWPATARTLAGIVKRLAPNLRAAGIAVETGHRGRGRQKRKCMTLRRMDGGSIDPNGPIVPASGKTGSNGVAGVANSQRGVARGSTGAAPGPQLPLDLNPIKTGVGSHGAVGVAKTHPDANDDDLDHEIEAFGNQEDAIPF